MRAAEGPSLPRNLRLILRTGAAHHSEPAHRCPTTVCFFGPDEASRGLGAHGGDRGVCAWVPRLVCKERANSQ